MIIIPERKIVLIQPPRTASTSIRESVRKAYPKAMCLYRHMEWAGVPRGYERYLPVYISRDPVHRLYSLWKYMANASSVSCPNAPQEWIARQNADADRPFREWVSQSNELFNDAGTSPDGSYYSTYRQIPAARKSFWHFMSNRDGTLPTMRVIRYTDVWKKLDLEEVHLNASNDMLDYTASDINAVMARHYVDYCIWHRQSAPALKYNHEGEDNEIRFY